MTTSREICLASRPVGMPAAENFAVASRELAAPGPGEVLVENKFISVDPYMRGRMYDRPSYVPPFQIGEALQGGAIGVVVESNAEDLKKGDIVSIYLPMLAELPVAMLACARIGAVHSVVFAGFSAEALRARVVDSQCKLMLTADEGLRATKVIKLKGVVDTALAAECERRSRERVRRERVRGGAGAAGVGGQAAYVLTTWRVAAQSQAGTWSRNALFASGR